MVLLLNQGAGHNIATHALPAGRNFFLVLISTSLATHLPTFNCVSQTNAAKSSERAVGLVSFG